MNNPESTINEESMMMMKFMRKVSFLLVVSFDNGTGTWYQYLVPGTGTSIFGVWCRVFLEGNNKQQQATTPAMDDAAATNDIYVQ